MYSNIIDGATIQTQFIALAQVLVT